MTCDKEKCWCPCREDMAKEIERLKRELEQAKRADSSALISNKLLSGSKIGVFDAL